MIEAVLPSGTLRVADPRLREIAQNFESIFVQMMLQSMRSGIKKSELLSGGRGEEVFTGLFDQKVADLASQRGKGLGLARMIVSQYERHVRASERGAAVDVKAGS